MKEDKSQLNLKCKIERNEVILKHFLKPVTYNFVSQDSNHPKPQEVNDLHIYKENIKNGQISLSLYNQEFHYWKSNYQVNFCTPNDYRVSKQTLPSTFCFFEASIMFSISHSI